MEATYVGEIRMFGGGFTPPGWVPCDGRELPRAGEFARLYEVIGNMYGGGPDTFAVPDLRDSALLAPAHAGVRFIIAATGARPDPASVAGI